MDPIAVVLLLLVAAVVLIAFEMLLPTHGVIGAAGAVAACGAVATAFLIHRWAGVGLMAGCAVATPFVFSAMLNVWDRSRLGKRLRLDSNSASPVHEKIEVGDVGTTLTDLRPMGHAAFGPVDVQVIAERGKIAVGTPVRVTDYRDGVATVTAIPSEGSLS